jgi:leucine dehydrogenase
VFYAMRVAAERRFGARDLAGRRVAIQGLGHVGWHLAKLLRAAGAELIVSDIDTARAEQAARSFGATAVAPEDILTAPPTSFAPCAIGGVITEEVAARLPRADGLRRGEQPACQRRGGRRPA